jgi:hypothetical protein
VVPRSGGKSEVWGGSAPAAELRAIGGAGQEVVGGRPGSGSGGTRAAYHLAELAPRSSAFRELDRWLFQKGRWGSKDNQGQSLAGAIMLARREAASRSDKSAAPAPSSL